MAINLNLNEFCILLSIVLRLSVILFMLPVFNITGMPANIKALLVFSFSIMLLPIVRQSTQPLPLDIMAVVPVAVGELIFGIIFSLSMLIILGAFQLGGELIGFNMGFGFSQAADPQSGARFNILSVWTQMLATMVFFSINGHHFILKIIVESFKTVPIGSFALNEGVFARVVMLSGMLFVLAVKLAAPILSVILLTQAGLGFISKFAPQINILTTSFPLTIGIGLLFFGLSIALWAQMGKESFTQLFQFLENLPG